MRVNSTLVLWNGGWVEVSDPAAAAAAGYRAEAFLSLGSQHDEAEAVRQAERVIAEYQDPRLQIEARFDPSGPADRPYTTWRPGDVVDVGGSAHRVRSMRVSLDDNGPTFDPTFGDALPTPDERAATTMKKMAGGTLGGDARIATPVSLGSAPRAAQAGDTPAEIMAYRPGPFHPVSESEFARSFTRVEATTWHVTVNVAAVAVGAFPAQVWIEGFVDGPLPDPPGGPGCFWTGFPIMRYPEGAWGPASGRYVHASYTFVVSTLPGAVRLGGVVGLEGTEMTVDEAFYTAAVWVSYVAVPSTGESNQGWACGT